MNAPASPGSDGGPRARLHEYALLMRLDKPIGAFLLAWPTVWALMVAGQGYPDGKLVLIFLAGVLLMRSAGCVINDFADREFDPHVVRTRHRPLAAGRVSRPETLLLFCILGLVAFGLVLLTNRLTVYLSIAGIVLAVVYPFVKRVTYIPQVFLGMAFGWSIPMAFAAQTGAITPVAGLLFLATVLWAVAYDTLYAMVDREDDMRIGVKSTAILFGEQDRFIVGIVQFLFLLALVLAGLRAQLAYPYFGSLGIVALLMIYQQYLIRKRDPEGCFRAFLNNSWIGLAVALGVELSYLFGNAHSSTLM